MSTEVTAAKGSDVILNVGRTVYGFDLDLSKEKMLYLCMAVEPEDLQHVAKKKLPMPETVMLQLGDAVLLIELDDEDGDIMNFSSGTNDLEDENLKIVPPKGRFSRVVSPYALTMDVGIKYKSLEYINQAPTAKE